MGRCRFDTLGKSNPAHRAGAPTARGRWVAPPRWVSASAAGPPTTQGHFPLPLSGLSNLHLPISVWYSCNWNGQAHPHHLCQDFISVKLALGGHGFWKDKEWSKGAIYLLNNLKTGTDNRLLKQELSSSSSRFVSLSFLQDVWVWGLTGHSVRAKKLSYMLSQNFKKKASKVSLAKLVPGRQLIKHVLQKPWNIKETHKWMRFHSSLFVIQLFYNIFYWHVIIHFRAKLTTVQWARIAHTMFVCHFCFSWVYL